MWISACVCVCVCASSLCMCIVHIIVGSCTCCLILTKMLLSEKTICQNFLTQCMRVEGTGDITAVRKHNVNTVMKRSARAVTS